MSDLKFKPLSVSDKKALYSVTERFDNYSDFNFVSLLTWGVNNSTAIAYHGENLVIRLRSYTNKEQYTYSVIGDQNIIETVEFLLNSKDIDRLELIPEFIAKEIEQTGQFIVTHDRDEDDYIYDIKKLVEMDGPEYRKHRRSISNFKTKNTNTFEFREVVDPDPGVLEQILDLTKHWRGIRSRVFTDASSEYYAIRRALRFLNDLDLKIWCIFNSENKIVGFTIIEIQSNVATIHFEKADTTIPGIGVYLKHNVCTALLELECEWLNYEQDLGIEGLRELKLSLNPEKFLKKYTIEKSKPMTYEQ